VVLVLLLGKRTAREHEESDEESYDSSGHGQSKAGLRDGANTARCDAPRPLRYCGLAGERRALERVRLDAG
jgi:hypothetical protein